MPHYKLTYFKVTARGELPRLVFKAAGVDFEDERIDREEMARRKADMPFGQIPVLEEDGKVICQSIAISRYLARKFGLAGGTDWEQAQTDMVVDCLEDLIKPLGILWYENEPDKKEEMKKTYFDETMPKLLGYFEKMLMSNGGGDGFFVGNELTYADLAFYHYLDYPQFFGVSTEQVLANFPKMSALKQRIAEIPRIAQWLQDRPANDMSTAKK